MNFKDDNIFVVALGGSIVFPDRIDWHFLKKFRAFIKKHIKKGKKFIIVVGGGKLCRLYIEAANKVVKINNDDKDWLGIHATRSNAHLLRAIFHDVSDPVVIDERFKVKKLTFSVTIASGWQPGWSTDYIASVCASDFGADNFIVAGKPDFVYDKDNVKHNDAKPFKDITWSEYRKLIISKWVPGANVPVDPVAARFAQKNRLRSVVIQGTNLENFDRLLNNKEFTGTIIR